MPYLSIENRLAEVFRDYLGGVAAVPVRTFDDAVAAKAIEPLLLIRPSAFNPTDRKLTLSVELHSITTGDRSTSPTQCAEFLGAVRARLANRRALYAFLATLPADRRTGWQLLHHAMGDPESALDDKENRRIDSQPFTMTLRVAEIVGATTAEDA